MPEHRRQGAGRLRCACSLKRSCKRRNADQGLILLSASRRQHHVDGLADFHMQGRMPLAHMSQLLGSQQVNTCMVDNREPTDRSFKGATAIPVATVFSAALWQARGSSRRSNAEVSCRSANSAALGHKEEQGQRLVSPTDAGTVALPVDVPVALLFL